MENLGTRYLGGIGLGLALGFVVAVTSIPALAGVVDFSDPGLEAAIREAISKPTGDILDTDSTIIRMMAVCPVSEVASSVARCYDEKGLLKSVAFLEGSISN